MDLSIRKNLGKVECFLQDSNFEEAIEKSCKILEKCLEELFKLIFPDLKIDTQLKILNEIKENFDGKRFHELMMGQKLKIFDNYSLLANYAGLSKEINPKQLQKINSLRVDSAHQKRKISKGDAHYVYSMVLRFLDKCPNILGIDNDEGFESESSKIEIYPSQDSIVFENLPEQDYIEFIGRETKIKEIRDLLLHEKVHVLSIDGIGGVGKSALALEVAHHFKENKFFDSLIWVSAKRDKLTYKGIVNVENKFDNLEDLFNEILYVFSEEDFVKHGSLETKERKVLELLKENHCLLIVDNLETIDDENLKSFLIDINFPIESKVLITSRKRLGQVEYIVYLDIFTIEESNKYINSQLKFRSYKGKCSEKLIKDIYEKTGGIPLAIKVIIPWIMEGKIRDEFVGDIDKDTDILKFCFEKVYNEFLSNNSKKLFCVLSQAPTELSDTALKFVSGLSENAFNESLSSLINYSLVFKSKKGSETEQLFSMLPLTQEFGKRTAGYDFPNLKDKINKDYLRYIELSNSEEHSAKRAISINRAEEARRLFSGGNSEDAEKLFKEAIEYDSGCDYALYLFAIFSKERQDFGRATNLIERALKHQQRKPLYWEEYSAILEASGDYKKSERVLEEALKKTYNDRNIVQKLCLIKTKLQKNKDVIKIVKSSIDKNNPDKKNKFINSLLTVALLEAYWRLASGQYKRYKIDEAFELLSEAVLYLEQLTKERLIFPSKANLLWEEKKIFNRLGDIARKKGEVPLARVLYKKAIYKFATFNDRKRHNHLIEQKIQALSLEC